ncbi:MAG: hypothetical protein LUB59_07885 [Candidatus Gastranaerophilales bacterium]|nr:hypothetical protein [Candidatus Gastranaerophilales bacterium]
MTISVYQQNVNVQFPTKERNYCQFDEIKVLYYLSQKEKALPHIDNVLKTTDDEREVTESLYIVNRMLDDKIQGIDKMYPSFSRFNDTKSPNIQTFLAGIYRKTKVPDAFGPLIKMLITNSINSERQVANFDPNEEIGGAILDYLV